MHIDERNRDKEPASKGEKFFIIVLSIAFLLMMTMEVITNFEPKKLGALLFVVFRIPLLFIHEFGHAIVAKLLGWRIQRTVIGFGKVLANTKMLGAPMEIRSIPLEGFVEIAPKTVHLARFKHALIYFSGPGIELLMAFLIMLYLGGVTELFTVTNDYGRIALQSFAYAAFAGAVINLIPIGITTKEGSTPNDGMGILTCLFSSGLDYELWIRENEEQRRKNK